MRIAIIGGGSLRAPLLLRGLLGVARQGTLPIKAVALFDPDAERLAAVEALHAELLEGVAAPFALERSLSLEEAVRAATVVILTVRPGGDAARIIDEAVPLSYGVLGQESAGAGGFAQALRAIPVAQACAQAVRRLAPAAWVLCLTNPAGVITQALRDDGFARALGICEAPAALRRALEQVAGPEAELLQFQYVGLNHLGWMQHLRLGERDFLGDLVVRWDALPARLRRFPADRVRELGTLPGEYLYYYYSTDHVVERWRAAGQTRAAVVAALNGEAMRELKAARADGRPRGAWRAYEAYLARREGSRWEVETSMKDPEARLAPGHGYEETIVSLLVGLHYQIGDAFLNMPNAGTIAGLADDDVVEVQADLGEHGPVPLPVDEPRSPAFDLIRKVKEFERLTVKAAASGSYMDAFRALGSHPLVPSRRVARQILDTYLREHAGLLPQFA